MRLLDVQELDTRASQLRHRRGALPESADLARVQQERAAVADDLVAARTRLDDLQRAQRRAEADLEPVRARRERNQQRLDAGQVSDPKAAQALMEETEHLAGRIARLEDAELEIMQEVEDAAGVVERVEDQLAGIDEKAAGWRSRRDASWATIDAELGELAGERELVVGDLPDDLMALYEKSRAAHGGLGAAALVQRRCTGCRLEANAADLRTYASAPADAVLTCEECGRLLVRTSESGL